MNKRSRCAGIGVVLAVAAMALGCTNDGQEVRADEGVDAAATVAAAVDGLNSGRFRQSVTMDLGAMSPSIDGDEGAIESDGPMTTETEGEFSAGDFTATSTTSGSGGALISSEVLFVDGVAYHSADSFTGSMLMPDPGDQFGVELEQQAAAMGERIGDRQWLEMPGTGAEETGDFAGDVVTGVLFGPSTTAGVPADVLDGLEAVKELDPVEVDGEQRRRFEGRIPEDESLSDAGDDLDPDSPEARERLERVEQYLAERSYTSVEVQLDGAGSLRRIDLQMVDEVEEQYQGCYFGFDSGFGMSVEMSFEIFDVGAEIAIDPPDPATVVPASEVEEILAEQFESFLPDDMDAELESMDDEYEARRDASLADGASLIGLDPATIAQMTEDEKDDAEERIIEAAEALPTFDTPIGQLNRLEMLNRIRLGISSFGVPQFDPTGFTDEQLAEMITGFVEASPELNAMFGEDGLASDVGDEYEDYDQFEDCPA